VLVKVVENDLGLLAALQLEDDAQPVAIALIADVGDALDLFVVQQRGGVLDQVAGLLRVDVGQLLSRDLARLTAVPPVGKSGPGTISIIFASGVFGF